MALDSGSSRFATTRWSLVVAAGDRESPERGEALAVLCEAYWYPVYAFIRRTGRSTDDARDLTQAFFARVLEKNYFKDARQERGRFRAFLLTAVRHFLANEYDRATAQKRGGAQPHFPLEFDDGERRYVNEPADALTPEALYERRWALATLDAALARLRERYSGDARRRLFDHLRPFLTGDEPPSYATLAAGLEMTEGALRVAVHRLRQHFAASLRGVIGETVETADAVEDELRHLMAVVSR